MLNLPETEYQTRFDVLLTHCYDQKLDGFVLFNNAYVLYYTGFAFIPTERPIAFIMNKDGTKILFVPRLEKEHAQQNSLVERVEYYNEYPDQVHPMEVLKEILYSLGINDAIGIDSDGYPMQFGYRGPALSEITRLKLVNVTNFIEVQMMIKSPSELALIRESVKWSHLAHTFLQRYTRIGLTETEVSQRASQEATRIMLDTIGPIYQAQSPFSNGASAGYRGQIGRNAAIPHSLAHNITFQAGDVLVSGAGAPVWGYNSELERTMIIGPASAQQKRMFEHMLALQDIALASLKPGVRCSEVDQAVRRYFDKHGLTPYWKHHSGHAIGLRYHEGPFLDLGDHTEIKPGMVFTVEPGLYDPESGGYRHSDTVVITPDANEVLTYYPRDLVSLTIPV